MPWTYDQRLVRARASLTDNSLLSEDEIVELRRPLFFGSYSLGLGVTPIREQWFQYDTLKEAIILGLQGRDYHLQTNKRTLQFNVFSSDVSVLRWFIKNHHSYMFSHLRIISKEYWGLKPPKTRRKTTYYGQFGWRITFKDPHWGSLQENVAELESIGGPHKLVMSSIPNKPGTFLYLSKLSDVLLFKLMHAESISDIEERSNSSCLVNN